MASEAQSHHCVVLHAHFGWSGNSALRATRKLVVPLVTTFYGRDLAARRRRFTRYDVYERLFEEGNLFVCEGPHMAQTLQAIGCPPAKIRLVRIGLDLDRFPFSKRVRTRPLVVAHTARLVEKKGTDLALRAYARALPDLRPCELWIIGEGPQRPSLEAIASELEINPYVRFFGEVTHDRLRELMKNVHICIQPSRTAADGDTEGGAPTVLMEMQAAGAAVVATAHADIPYVVPFADHLAPEEDVGCLAETLLQVATLPEDEWRDRAVEARRFVEEHHDARVIARQIEGLYAEARELDGRD